MNVSQPLASSIGSVDFSFLSADEIKELSVKRIQNPTTFDTLLHPIPGGLYDLALGSWGDNQCATCNLNGQMCPGHVGHIELPVPVYHPTFLDQLFRLFRGKCAYCHRLKIARADANHIICKLRLIQHGLVNEAVELEELHLTPAAPPGPGDAADDSDSVHSVTGLTDDLLERRTAFVRDAIRGAGRMTRSDARTIAKTEVVAEARRAVIKSFLAAIVKTRVCGNCNGISPSYRKDQFVKIFEKALSPKDYAKMVQGGFKITNASVLLGRQRKAMEKRRKEAQDKHIDEGIGADLTSDPDEDGEDVPSDSGDDVMSDAPTESTPDAAPSHPKKADKEAVQRFVNAGEVHAALTLLFEKEREILGLIYHSRWWTKPTSAVSADMFFVKCILVPPNRYRPEARTGESEIAEAPQNKLFQGILVQCESIHRIHRDILSQSLDSSQDPSVAGQVTRRRDMNDLQQAWVRLQEAFNSLIDRDRNPIRGPAGKQNEEGIKQKLEKKEGLFRKNMMGKRVNFAARSVISPDPNVETNEIGVPPVFAKKLTYPEPVTNHNFRDLKEAVLNGVDRWPGAAAIENENGQVINLRTKNLEERQALANQLLAPSSATMTGARNKKVHRHLNNGDVVLMNRQPTLHKPSMMAHRTRVLPGEKTIRMHYANCNTYNADFDGDEMNMHFPQNEIARAEALQIADTDHQYLVATSGKPLRGLIQDHISIGVWMTSKDTMFDREKYHQLLYACLRPEDNHTNSNRIIQVPPAIMKPRPLWTGKQIISTVLLNLKPPGYPGLTLTSKSQTVGDRWGKGSEEGTVLLKDGEMLIGILDKAQLGPTSGGLIHSVYEVYGHTIAGKLLSVLGRLLTKFLHMRAFSCGMEDLVLTAAGEAARKEKLKGIDQVGLEVAAKYVSLTEHDPSATDAELRARMEEVLRDGEKQSGLDLVMNSRTKDVSSEVTMACLPLGLVKPFPHNQMQTMTSSGAKGSPVTANLISCNLGQQVLEGKRVPVMVSGKTLPCFRPFDTSPRAGGYVADRFLTGVRPAEYFFHAMAGREGLIDTAVKTSRSGYLQRCLIKGMEGLKVAYDDSIRDANGSIVQFLYGEDGLEVTKQKRLTDFKFVAENFWSHFEQLNVRNEFHHIDTDAALDWSKSAMKKVRKTGRIDAMDPVLARFSPSRTPYSTSESFTTALKEYTESNPEKLLRDKKKGIADGLVKKSFETVLNLKYLKSVVEPGEAVGIIAGQSIGEPSTQMTLNTFHLAGHSTKNVTLGIPRLREIVMSASKNISTPSMTLHLNPELTKEDAETFAKVISRLTLAEIIDQVTIREAVQPGLSYAQAKIYAIRIDFFPAADYRQQYAIEIDDVALALEKQLMTRLTRLTRAELKKKVSEQKGQANVESDALPEIGQSVGTIEQATSRGGMDDDGGNDGDDDDGDATNTKQKANRSEAISYDAPDEGEERIAQQAQRDATPELDEMEDEGIGGSPRETGRDSDGDLEDEKEKEVTTEARKRDAKARRDRIMGKDTDVTGFDFDDRGGQWCEFQLEYESTTPKLLMLNLVETACRQAIIQSVPGIGSCTVSSEKKRDAVTGIESEEPIVVTEGVNLPAMQAYQSILNPHQIYTNDIAAVLAQYGVEACRATIIREMDTVFTSHSISVDTRHLTLVAEMMTRGGGFLPFSRTGLRTSTSPFLKMSFETTLAFLRDAVLDADVDDLTSPSSRIVLGKTGTVGTGAFDVLTALPSSGSDSDSDLLRRPEEDPVEHR